MLRRQISAIMIIVFVVFILINFIFSYSLFTFYKSAREEIEQEILREEREEEAVIRSGEIEKAIQQQHIKTRLHFNNEQPRDADTISDAPPTADSVTDQNNVDTVSEMTTIAELKNQSMDYQEGVITVNARRQKQERPQSHSRTKLKLNFTTTIEPKPEYYNSDEYYGDSNENLADKNYNNYDEGKFIVVTAPGVKPENNKIN